MWTACQDGESDHDCRNHVRLCEALSYAKAKIWILETVLKSVATGAAGSKQPGFLLERRYYTGDHTPGFL